MNTTVSHRARCIRRLVIDHRWRQNVMRTNKWPSSWSRVVYRKPKPHNDLVYDPELNPRQEIVHPYWRGLRSVERSNGKDYHVIRFHVCNSLPHPVCRFTTWVHIVFSILNRSVKLTTLYFKPKTDLVLLYSKQNIEKQLSSRRESYSVTFWKWC